MQSIVIELQDYFDECLKIFHKHALCFVKPQISVSAAFIFQGSLLADILMYLDLEHAIFHRVSVVL